MWRSRWSMVVIVLVCVASAAGVTWWSRRRSPLLRQGGSVVVVSPSTEREDRWTYLTTPAVEPPAWWDDLPGDRPLIYVNLGSSGRGELLACRMIN